MAKTDWTARTAAIEYFTKAARQSWGDSEMRDLYEAAVHALRRSQDHTALQTRCNEFAAEADALRATVARLTEYIKERGHTDACEYAPDVPCFCGYDAALAEQVRT